jgi:fatty acid amide hydrolase
MAPDAPPRPSLLSLSAAETARRIARGDWTSAEVVESYLGRIAEVEPQIHAVAVPLFDQARREAEEADRRRRSGQPLGPLHGVPITVKECFFLAGTPSCIGLSRLRSSLADEDGVLVRRLRRAGGIVLAKTNVPQMMIWHECDNPVYGRTNNPWDLSRTPGGSTGGEAALIAARGSPLGLGNDLGGSIRVPCHFCGIHGLMTTSFRLPRNGSRRTMRGMEAVISRPGPMARHVEDLELALGVLADASDGYFEPETQQQPSGDWRKVPLEGMRIAFWPDDGYFPSSPAVRRAVRQAADALARRGAIVEEVTPTWTQEAMEIYFSLLGADGGADARRLTRGSPLDWRVRRMLAIAGMPASLRHAVVAGLKLGGQRWMATLATLARPRSADEYWQLVWRRGEFVRRWLAEMTQAGFQAFLMPPHALPAPPHRKAFDLIPAASYSMVPNLLGIPAGVVSLSRVRSDEQSGRPSSRDTTERQAAATDEGSAGLPVAVQAAALHWREDVVLAIMRALEEEFCQREDFPLRAWVPG